MFKNKTTNKEKCIQKDEKASELVIIISIANYFKPTIKKNNETNKHHLSCPHKKRNLIFDWLNPKNIILWKNLQHKENEKLHCLLVISIWNV